MSPALEMFFRGCLILIFVAGVLSCTSGIFRWLGRSIEWSNGAQVDEVMEEEFGNRLSDDELLRCAQINFENFERAFPLPATHPFFRLAKAQLDEALGGPSVEEALASSVNEETRDG